MNKLFLLFFSILFIGFASSTVILNSPSNNSLVYTKQVILSTLLNSTNGEDYSNISLYDNSSGSWELRNTTNKSIFTIQKHNVTFDAVEDGQTGKRGEKIKVGSYNVTLNYFSIDTSGTVATKGYVLDGNQNVLATTDIVDGRATFSGGFVLNASTEYFLAVDKDGAAFSGNYKTTGLAYPYVDSLINWTAGLNWNEGVGTEWVSTVTNASIINGTDLFSSPTLFLNTYQFNSTILWNAKGCINNGTCLFSSNNYTFSVPFLENNRTYNSTTYATKSETYSVDVSGQVSAVKLLYNGTAYSMTNEGDGIWSITKDAPNSSGNNTIAFSYTYLGVNYNSTNTYQYVNSIDFALCNATYTSKYLNLTFKDEENGTRVNASIPTSTFVYYIGSGTTNKTYTYSNISELLEYNFCFSNSSFPINVKSSISYVKTGYPQRNSAETLSLSSVLKNLTYYLLDSSSGIYVTFQVLNGANQPISGVDVIVNRTISSTSTTISTGTTGTDGGVTFWLNPDFSHSLLFSKTGYSDYSFSLTPTQTLYTITLGEKEGTITPDYSSGIYIRLLPSSDFLVKDTEYNFNYTISSTVWNLEEYGYNLIYSNGTVIDTQSGLTDSGGVLNTLANVSNVSRIIMNYYYIVNSTQINGTRYWIISGSGDYSLTRLFNDISTSIDNNLYGINGSDNDSSFSKALISGLILVGVTFGLSKRYGIVSEPAVMGLIFGLTLLLNELNMIPNPDFFSSGVFGLQFGDVIVIITALLMISFIVKEERY